MGKRRKTAKIFEQNPTKTFEQDTSRSTWEETQGKVGPTIVKIGKDGRGKARHLHWRNSAHHRSRLDAVATIANKHVKVRP